MILAVGYAFDSRLDVAEIVRLKAVGELISFDQRHPAGLTANRHGRRADTHRSKP